MVGGVESLARRAHDPGSRAVTYNYASGLDASISRLTSMIDGTTTFESLSYLGLGTVVERNHPEASPNLNYYNSSTTGDAGDNYVGLDRFGRVVDQKWTTSDGSGTVDRYKYGYDRDSNRLWRENTVNTAFSELYAADNVDKNSAYDKLNRLTGFQRGTLSDGSTGKQVTSNQSRTQDWTLDALGNWTSVASATTGSPTTQNRTANGQNQIASISGATTPTYDDNGNTTKDETAKTYAYDAWNRQAAASTTGGSGSVTDIADLNWTSQSNGWGPPEENRSNGEQGSADGGTITMGGQTYPKGLGTHALSDVRYDLNGAYTSFKATVGIDDEVGASGSVKFQVWGDGLMKYESPSNLTGTSAAVAIDVNITGVDELKLIVTNGGDNIYYDHADWANARFETAGTTEIQRYKYDALGRRTVENAQSGGTPTDLYYSSNWQVLEEQQSGSTKQTYVYSPVYVDAIVARDATGTSSTQGGTLDTSFSTDGKQTINEAGLSEEGKDVAIDPSTGKVVVVGITSGNLKVARLNTDGAMDNTFGGTDGLAETSFAGGSVALSVVIDGSSKIYASGAGNSNFATARFTSTGGVDTSWGGTGGVETDFGGSNEQARDSVLDSSGKLIVAGESGGNFALARLGGSNGALDTGFDTDGKLTTDFGSSTDAAYGVALQSDGKVVVVGVSGSDIAVARYNTDGSLDTAFDGPGTAGNGKFTLNLGGTEAGRSVAVVPTGLADAGKIVIGGDKDGNFVLVRLNSDGTYDTNFNYSGTSGVSVAADFGSTDAAKDVAIQPSDGKIVAVGSSNGNFALARYNTNGSLDENFDTDGKLTTDFGATDVANGVAIVPAGFTDSGKIVAAGVTGADYAIARYNPGTSGTSTTRLYVMQDANFNVTGIVGTNGAVKARYVYDPYGAKTSLNASWAAVTDVDGLLYGHQGGRYDPATNTVDQRSRARFVSLGTFAQQDQIGGYVDGANLYLFVESAPADHVDPYGSAGEATTRPSTGPATMPSTQPATRPIGDSITIRCYKVNVDPRGKFWHCDIGCSTGGNPGVQYLGGTGPADSDTRNPGGNGDPGINPNAKPNPGTPASTPPVSVPPGTCDCLNQKATKLNAVPGKSYLGLTSNSNSAGALILDCCGVKSPSLPLGVTAPGWGASVVGLLPPPIKPSDMPTLPAGAPMGDIWSPRSRCVTCEDLK